MRDLVVAGGGPVGLAVALHASRAGLDVVVREPREGPVDKACGEGLMPGAVADLADLGVAPHGHDLTGIHYLDARRGGEGAVAPFRGAPGRGVRRTVLHAALSAAVAEAGVPVEHVAVTDVRLREDHVLVDGDPARHLVAADGLHSPVRRLLGLEGASAAHRRYGLRCHVEQAPWTSFVEVHWSPRAEAYVTPVDEGLVGVAVLTAGGTGFEESLAGFPVLREQLTGTRTKVRGAGPLRQRVRARAAGRALLVGDAAGYVDALTGEGLALGLAQARLAVGCIVAGRVDDYPRLAGRLGWRQEALTHALLLATRPSATRRLLVPAATRLPRVFAAAVDQLARPAAVPVTASATAPRGATT